MPPWKRETRGREGPGGVLRQTSPRQGRDSERRFGSAEQLSLPAGAPRQRGRGPARQGKGRPHRPDPARPTRSCSGSCQGADPHGKEARRTRSRHTGAGAAGPERGRRLWGVVQGPPPPPAASLGDETRHPPFCSAPSLHGKVWRGLAGAVGPARWVSGSDA